MSRISQKNIALIEQLRQAKAKSLTLTAFLSKAAPILGEAKKRDETRALAEPLSRLLSDLEWSEKLPDYDATQAAVSSLLDGALASLQRGEFPTSELINARAALNAFLDGSRSANPRSHLPVLTQGLLGLVDTLFTH